LRVEVCGLRGDRAGVSGLAFEIWGSDLGLRGWGLGIWGLGFRVQGSVFSDQG